MTALIDKLREDALELRKLAIKKDPKGVHATLLVTVAAEAAAIGKREARQPTDDETAVVIRKFIKGIDDSIARARTEEEGNRFLVEKRVLDAYLPKPLTPFELKDAIVEAAGRLGLPIEMKSVKALLADLQAAYPGRVDGAAVSGYIKSA